MFLNTLLIVYVKQSLKQTDVGNNFFDGTSVSILLTNFPNKIRSSYIGVDLFESQVDQATHSVNNPKCEVLLIYFTHLVCDRFARRNCAHHRRVWCFLMEYISMRDFSSLSVLLLNNTRKSYMHNIFILKWFLVHFNQTHPYAWKP